MTCIGTFCPYKTGIDGNRSRRVYSLSALLLSDIRLRSAPN